jgi:hypothetical protein
MTAAYSGDPVNDILPLTSKVLNQDVQLAPTVTVASSLTPSNYGVALTFTATVTGNGTTAPTKTVNFLDGGVEFATANLSGSTGIVTFTTSVLTAATHTITAAYEGDTNYSAVTSPAISQVVNKTDTSSTLAATPIPGIAGLPVALTATVKIVSGAATITGTVTFTDGTTTLSANVPLSATGTATINPMLAPGTHTIVATYSGDANDNTSASSPLPVTVVQATTATTVTSTPNPSLVLYPVVFTARVKGNGATPTASVTFLADGKSLGSSTLDTTGTATFTSTALAVGTHSITAAYSGDTNDTGSTSSAISQSVVTIPTLSDLGISATNGTPPTTILVATVLNNAPSNGTTSLPTPTGTVTFSYGTTVVGSAPVDSSGVATLVPNLPSGTYNIASVYSGDGVHTASTSNQVTVSSTAIGFNLTVTPGKVTVATSQNVAVTVALTSNSGFTDTIGLGCARWRQLPLRPDRSHPGGQRRPERAVDHRHQQSAGRWRLGHERALGNPVRRFGGPAPALKRLLRARLVPLQKAVRGGVEHRTAPYADRRSHAGHRLLGILPVHRGAGNLCDPGDRPGRQQ